jgi:hypothetical protein
LCGRYRRTTQEEELAQIKKRNYDALLGRKTAEKAARRRSRTNPTFHRVDSNQFQIAEPSGSLFLFIIGLSFGPRRHLERGSGTEEILGKPVKMPSGDLYPSIDYWMPH